jgi:HD-GYP domain-containing protein (c-di-GMP phosphodiesterase class II)
MTTHKGVNLSEPESGYTVVPWPYLARLDEVPCDIFISAGQRPILYCSTGHEPEPLREKARAGVTLWCRESDTYLLRRMLTVSLNRTLADSSMPARERSNEAYKITAGILVGTLSYRTHIDADEVNLATETIDLLTKILSADDNELWSMVSAMQRNSATHHHAINTAVYSLALAKKLAITDFDSLRDIGRGAILMDLGLTTIPPRILERKMEEIEDPFELRALKMHPQSGYAIVARATGAAPSYAHIILEHHERLDGTGFPAGRRIGQISHDAQLVAIAETFDALANSGMAAFPALQEMRFGNPGRFNPEILAAFISLLGGWNGVRGAKAQAK